MTFIQQNWQSIIAILAFFYLTLEFVIEKGFGKKAFLASVARWTFNKLNAINDIKDMLEQQNKEYLSQAVLIYQILQKVEKIEREVKYNGGTVLLCDAVKDIQNQQAIFASEEEAKMFIDPLPIFKTEPSKGLTFVNAAWLEMVGCTNEDEMLGYGFMSAVPDENKDAVEKQGQRFEKNPVPFHSEFTYQHLKTKKLIQTVVRTQLIKDKKNNHVATIGTVTILN